MASLTNGVGATISSIAILVSSQFGYVCGFYQVVESVAISSVFGSIGTLVL